MKTQNISLPSLLVIIGMCGAGAKEATPGIAAEMGRTVVVKSDGSGNSASSTKVTGAVISVLMSATGQSLSVITGAATGSRGASKMPTLGKKAGTNSMTAAAAGFTGSPRTVTATATLPPPSTVYVDDGWSGVTPGDDPDGAGPATNFGTDAFITIQEAVGAVAVGGLVKVYLGTYDGSISVSTAGVTIEGEVSGSTRPTIDGGGETSGFTIAGSADNVTIKNFEIKSCTTGIELSGCDDVTISANNIHTNTNHGIYLNGSSGTQILDNTIGGNGQDGIRLANGSDNNEFRGNKIGVNATGTVALPNLLHGIEIGGGDCDNNTIGGSASGDQNTISGNGQHGIKLGGDAHDNRIIGNKIGTNAAGTEAIPNGQNGIHLQGNPNANWVGGSEEGEGNLIAGNTGIGVAFFGGTHDNRVEANQIGTSTIPNGAAGVRFRDNSRDNLVIGNTIRSNTGGGVISTSSYISNVVRFNSIAGNSTYGVQNTAESPLDGAYNWWGNATGPQHSSNVGGSGDAVSDDVAFTPFLTQSPIGATRRVVPPSYASVASFGNTNVSVNFSTSGSGGTLDVARFDVTPPAGSFSAGGSWLLFPRYWEFVDDGSFSAMTGDIVLRYGDISGIATSNLRIAKRAGLSGNGIPWNVIPLANTVVNSVSKTITATGQTGFSQWTILKEIPLPTLTSISPSSATIGSTLNLTVLGDNFGLGATSASFSGGGITVNSVTINSRTQLTANVTITPAASPTYRDILVTNSYGTGTYSNGFQVKNPAPTITSVSPVTGVAGQSLSDTVQGTGFISGTTTVSFGAGIAVNSVSVSNDHTLIAQLAISSGATTGVRNVVVSNPTPGGGTATLTGAFSVIPVPTLTSVSPNTGVRGQAFVVLLNGTNFVSGTTTISFGSGITSDSVSVVSSSQVRAYITISLAAATGAKDVSVSNSGPTGTVTLVGGFTVTNPAPTIASVVPGVGARGKLVSVAINGSGFIPGVTTALPVAGMTLVSATFVSTTQITGSFYIARDAALGFRDMTITNSSPGGGSATLTNAFEVQNPSPAVLSVSPNTGVIGQSLSVVVTGTDFVSGVSSVDFGTGITAGAVTIDSTGTHLTAGITIASGATAGLHTVTVTNSGPGGGSSALANAFTIANLAPTLTSLSTYAAGRGQTLNVTMTGTNFATGITTATFGVNITVNSLTISSPTSAIANISVAASAIIGARSVSVTNASPGGGTATLVSVFNVGNPTPTLSAIAPAIGARGQTLDVVITGTGFVSGTSTLTLGADITVNSFTVTSFTQIHANITIALAAAVGGRDVTVTNGPPGGGSGLLAAGFTVNNPLPTLSNLSPSSANRGSIVNVTVTGSQFITGVTSLNFGADIVVNSIVVKSPTEILANITLASLAASGARTVTATNATPGGGSANLPAGFTVGTGTATSVEGNLGLIPDEFALHEAYPNPFNPSTRIRYGVPEDSRVRIVIHNMLGNIVADLVNGERSKGTYELQWHADYLPSGVYLVRMNAESSESTKRYISSRKIILMK